MVRALTPVRLGMALACCALCCVLAGCGKNKVTKENYDKVENGMTLDQVEALLGEGTKAGDGSNMGAQVGIDVTGGAGSSSTVEYGWESGKHTITVSFRQGKVVQKRNTGL